ncbi:MAG: hypothetical protein MZU97_12285 [Bacillus subtilis]|nr:hypothetical protein [Bacillus subtilis]
MAASIAGASASHDLHGRSDHCASLRSISTRVASAFAVPRSTSKSAKQSRDRTPKDVPGRVGVDVRARR